MQPKLFNGLLLAGLSTFAVADDSQQALSEMVVTANRAETPSSHLSQAVTVFTRQDIERRQAKSLVELLQVAPGLTVNQNGGPGKISSVFIRGTNSDQLLVLVNGIRIGSVSSGTTPFEYLPIDLIERVEIIRGPTSSIYGSEALGGVIQIFTRKVAEPEKPHVSIQAGGGSYGTDKEAGQVSGNWNNTWYNLGIAHQNTHGINARRPISGAYGFDQADHDAHENTSITARVGHRFDNKAEIDAFVLRAQGDTEFDSDYGGDRNTFVNQSIGLNGAVWLNDAWRSSLNLGQSRDDYDTFCMAQPSQNNLACQNKTYAHDTRFRTTRWNATWLNEYQISDRHKLNFGTDYRYDEMESSENYSKSNRYDVGVFANLQSQLFERHFVNASLRWDQNEAAGKYWTGNIGWRYALIDALNLVANFGHGFKAPSFNQLYYPYYGNPHLRAEESSSVEVGFSGKHAWASWDFRAYHTDVDQLIITVTDPVTYNSTAENVDKAQIDGLEATLDANWKNWHARLNLNLLSPVNRISNNRLPRRPDKTLMFDLSHTLGRFENGLTAIAQSLRYDNASNTKVVSGFVTLDLRSVYQFNEHWSINAQLSNILDKRYQTVDTYNSMGRNFFLSVHYQY